MDRLDRALAITLLQDARMHLQGKSRYADLSVPPADVEDADATLLKALREIAERPICHHFDRGWNTTDPLHCRTCRSWDVVSCRVPDCPHCLIYRILYRRKHCHIPAVSNSPQPVSAVADNSQ
jgi:hypothetical protein